MTLRNLTTLKSVGPTILMVLAIATGCASTPPSKTLPQSEVAVKSVDHSNYHKHTSNEVNAVKTKLQQAKQNAADKQHEEAEQLAQQILVDVELIKLKTQRMSSDQEVNDLESSIVNLNNEIQWRAPVQVSPLNN